MNIVVKWLIPRILYVVVGMSVSGVIAYTWCNHHVPIIPNEVNRPYIPPFIKELSKVEGSPTPKEIVVLRPSQREIEAIQEAIGGPLPSEDLLGIVEVGKLPYGGKVIETITPVFSDKYGKIVDKTTLTVYPNKRPFYEWIGKGELGLYSGYLENERVYNFEFSEDVLRLGPIILTGKTGIMWGDINSNKYILVGIKVNL